MAIVTKKTSDVHVVNRGIKMVVYGGAGIGKTRLCATAPKPLIISAESGLLSLRTENIDYIEIKTQKDFEDAYKFVASPECTYETVCIDSASEIAETLLIKMKVGLKEPRQAYLQLGEFMLDMIRKFRDLPDVNVIFNFKMKSIEDESSGTLLYIPMCPGKMIGDNLPYMFDEVFCMQLKKDGTRYLQTAADRSRFCKDRSGSLEKEEQPNLTLIINKIRGT